MPEEVLGSVEGAEQEDDQQAKQLDSLLSKLSGLPALLEQVQGMETKVKLVSSWRRPISARSMTPASRNGSAVILGRRPLKQEAYCVAAEAARKFLNDRAAYSRSVSSYVIQEVMTPCSWRQRTSTDLLLCPSRT